MWGEKMNDKENYKALSAAWIEENMVNLRSCERAIEDAEHIKSLNAKQAGLYMERIRAAVDSYNEWAKENAECPMDYPC